MSVFVDTGILFAAALSGDARHRSASNILRALARERPVTTDHVVVETWALLRARVNRPAAMRFWAALSSTPLTVEYVTAADMERALAVAGAWAGQDFDIVDCTSFVTMERLGCRRVATFDDDFAIYRFGPRRREAFELIR